MKKFFIICLIALVNVYFSLTETRACTTAIITGKCTVDGRPLLYKHRDADSHQNKLMYFQDGTYNFIGLVNAADREGKEVWSGANSAGFAIMNSASYNLYTADTTRQIEDQEGVIMKAALGSCASLEDFEKLLAGWPKPMGIEANFGVIDAKGGAAYYETADYSFKKIDANDPAVAPFGYLIRTNYSFTGVPDAGYGYIRYLTASELIYNAVGQNLLDYKFLLQNVSRSLKHSLLDLDLKEMDQKDAGQDQFVFFEDYIPRHSSVSVMVVQGLKPGESPALTTLWTILGFPLCSVAFPTWISGEPLMPALLIADDSGNAPLCEMALQLKSKCFPIKRGSGKRYLNLNVLHNKHESGILQKLPLLENDIFDQTQKRLSHWRASGIDQKDLQALYKTLTSGINKFYSENFEE